MFDLQALLNDGPYMQFVRKVLGRKVRGLRRRGLIAALYRAIQESSKASGQRTVTGVEVGVKFGTLSQQILECLPEVRMMTLVDPWKEYPQEHTDREKFGYAGRNQAGWDRVYEDCCKRMEPIGRRAKIIRAMSLDAARKLSTTRHFFVYIDAGHSYEDVLADCAAWWGLVEPGGLLAGDDYRAKGHHQRTESVSSAVEAFAAQVGAKIIGHHRNWFVQKRLMQ